MKKMLLNIWATTGISLVVLALVATLYDGTLICIETVFQVLGLNILIYIGLFLLDCVEYRYAILGTVLKLMYTIALVLAGGFVWDWYANLPAAVLVIMTIGIFLVSVGLDAISLLGEVKSINGLIGKEEF